MFQIRTQRYVCENWQLNWIIISINANEQTLNMFKCFPYLTIFRFNDFNEMQFNATFYAYKLYLLAASYTYIEREVTETLVRS